MHRESPSRRLPMRRFRTCLIGAILLLCVAAAAVASQPLSVQVHEAALHKDPTFLGPVVTTAPYGSTVTLVERHGDWLLVEFGGERGWVHASAVADHAPALRSGGAAAAGVSGQELALAGKGFNPAVEASFRASHGGGYLWVERAESLRYSPEELAAFLEEGGLNVEGGRP
ncbi:SH3 domain-containing protein [Oceanidesulfovibrio marinus]|uniref:SH3 domain-containing protein n=2 Tax=Oceanidesulfovibrio marinus TaxID=370038 RepID=A0A6P1ZL73_9BACT|nr:SH3 domain-containing protein [Oceanidesulfovibrio marinus]